MNDPCIRCAAFAKHQALILDSLRDALASAIDHGGEPNDTEATARIAEVENAIRVIGKP